MRKHKKELLKEFLLTKIILGFIVIKIFTITKMQKMDSDKIVYN